VRLGSHRRARRLPPGPASRMRLFTGARSPGIVRVR
jgi:hypothetical protein